jgi:glycosyltransferase involved in cell wall biosynthesis
MKAMLFAPLPPPVGGITSITAMLHNELGGDPELLFVQPEPKTASPRRFVRPFISIGRLVRGTLRIRRKGRVVFFCSSRASFWDKCAWATLVLALGRTAVMVMVAGDFPESFARSPRLARALAHWLFRRRNIIVAAQSPSWEAVYRGIFPFTRITQVGATVDAEFFQSATPSETPDAPLSIVYVGWIIEDKGIVDLLDAVERAAPSLRGRARIRLIGPLFGRDAYWQNEIDRRDLSALVELVGPVTSRAAMPGVYRAADIFVFPSHYEGFPVALLEAIAAGLPCIATDVGGVPDILDRGRAGVIVPPRAPEQLAAALTSLVSDPRTRRALGEAAARHARAAFSRSACIASYERALGLDAADVAHL